MVERPVVVTSEGLRALRESPLGKSESALLWHLISTLPLAGGVVVQSDLTSALNASKATIANAIVELRKRGYLVRGPKVGLSYHYKISPVFFKVLQ